MVNSFIARKDLDSEMSVVRNEFEMGENNPSSVMLKRMQSMLFDWHNYGNSTIGARSDIENVKIENLQAFYRKYYQPDNAVLTVAGKFDEQQVLRAISTTFGKLPRPTRVLPKQWTVEPTADGERQFTIRRKGEVQLVTLAYRTPSSLHPDSEAIGMAVEEGHLRADTDPAQMLFEVHGLILALHHDARFLRHPGAVDRARVAFRRVLDLYAAAPAPETKPVARKRAPSARAARS